MSSYKIIDHEYDVVVLGAGGSAPTLTTTAHKADLFGFLTASGTGGAYWFDGLVVGQNI